MCSELGGLHDAEHLAHEALDEGTRSDSRVRMVCLVPTAIDRVHSRDRERRCMRFTA